jgi:hypothetical protein
MRAGFIALFGLVCVACGKAEPDAAKHIGGAAAPLTEQVDVKMLDGKVEQATGKRQHKPLTIIKEMDKAAPAEPSTAPATQLVVPPPDDGKPVARDAASGLPTGKRQHKPVMTATPQ